MQRAIEEPAEQRALPSPVLVELILRDAPASPAPCHCSRTPHGDVDSPGAADADAGRLPGAGRRPRSDRPDRRGALPGALTPEQQALARNIFLRLTEPGEGTEDTRRRVPLRELAAKPRPRRRGGAPRQAGSGSAGDGGRRHRAVRPRSAHPRVAEARGWLNEDRESLRVHRHLTRSTQAWEAMRRDPGELYRGARLAAALDWADGRVDLTADERAFLEASGGPGARSSTRMRGGALPVCGIRSPASLAARARRGRLALVQRGHARHSATVAQAGRLAAQSREAAANIPTLDSFSHSRQADSTTPSTPAARSWGRSSTVRGSARGSRDSTRPSTPPRSVPTASSWRP